MSPQGELLHAYVAPQGEDGSPEIDRGQLRTLLADSLTPGTLHWNHKLTHVEALGQGEHRLHFANGASSVDTALLIGADGAWSQVRSLVSSAAPVYTGLTWMEAHFHDVDARHPGVAQQVGHGHTFAIGDNKGLMGQRNSNQHVRVYIAMRVPLAWHAQEGVDLADTAAVRAALLRHFAGWDAQLLQMISDNDGPYISRPLFVLPAPHSWPHTPGVTLLGDAAHLMSPFGGFGANLAMLEGCELALALAQQSTIEAAVLKYEQQMMPRSGAMATQANAVLDKVFKAGGSQHQPPDMAKEHASYRAEAANYAAPKAVAS